VRPVRDPRWLNSPVRRFARWTIAFLVLVAVFGFVVGASAWILRTNLTKQAHVSTP
jgi:hypothetical protein